MGADTSGHQVGETHPLHRIGASRNRWGGDAGAPSPRARGGAASARPRSGQRLGSTAGHRGNTAARACPEGPSRALLLHRSQAGTVAMRPDAELPAALHRQVRVPPLGAIGEGELRNF